MASEILRQDRENYKETIFLSTEKKKKKKERKKKKKTTTRWFRV